MPYAVFHDYDSWQSGLFLAKKRVYSDDEDFHNFNLTTPRGGPDFARFDNMVGGANNTISGMLVPFTWHGGSLIAFLVGPDAPRANACDLETPPAARAEEHAAPQDCR